MTLGIVRVTINGNGRTTQADCKLNIIVYLFMKPYCILAVGVGFNIYSIIRVASLVCPDKSRQFQAAPPVATFHHFALHTGGSGSSSHTRGCTVYIKSVLTITVQASDCLTPACSRPVADRTRVPAQQRDTIQLLRHSVATPDSDGLADRLRAAAVIQVRVSISDPREQEAAGGQQDHGGQ